MARLPQRSKIAGLLLAAAVAAAPALAKKGDTDKPKDDEKKPAFSSSTFKGLKLRVVAEGVETNAQRHFLEALGCDVLQGFLFGEAMPPMAFAKWLELNQRQLMRGVA